MQHISYLSLGSNMGDKKKYLEGAINSLRTNPHIEVVKVSKFYETEPYGYTEQDNFLNGVVKISTSLEPKELLFAIWEIENKFGRIREKKWGPRTLDIDILLYDNLEINEPDLIIPHAYLEKRAFVLVPLKEISPDLILPNGKKIDDLLELLKEDIKGVKVYE